MNLNNKTIIGFYNILEAYRHSYDNGAKGVLRVMNKASEKVTGEDGLRKFAEWYKEFYL